MPEPEYGKIGNLVESYDSQQRIARPIGLVVSSYLALKMYTMFKEGSNVPTIYIRDVKRSLSAKIKLAHKGLGQGYSSGLGFSIISEDALNIAVWNKGPQSTLGNSVFGFNNFNTQHISSIDIGEEGSFCVWELGIVAHERGAWKRFLSSRRRKADKKRYLKDTIEGLL